MWWEKRGRGGEAAPGARGGGQEEHRRTLRLTFPPAGPARHRHRGLLGPAPCSARRPRPDSSLDPTALLLGHVPKHAARSAVSDHHPFSPSRRSPNPRMALQWEAKGQFSGPLPWRPAATQAPLPALKPLPSRPQTTFLPSPLHCSQRGPPQMPLPALSASGSLGSLGQTKGPKCPL